MRDFVGRGFLLDGVAAQLADPALTSGYIVISGEPGIGKTAVAAALVERHGWVHHFNIGTAGIRSVADFLTNVCAQLIVRYHLPHDTLPSSAARDSGFLMRLLDEATAVAANRPVVVLVDALDEADDTGLPPSANRLLLPAVLPDSAYFVVTTRPKQSYRLVVDERRDLELGDDDPANLEDVRAYIDSFITAHADAMRPRLDAWGVDEVGFVAALTTRSEGNFMYLVHVLADIRAGRITAENIADLDALPRGLREYYARHWREVREAAPERFDRLDLPVVRMLATVREPVTVTYIAEWTQLERSEVLTVIDAWYEFFNEEPGDGEPRYRVYHQSFLDFMADEVGLRAAHRAIADRATSKIRW
jgi:hypothetical protein